MGNYKGAEKEQENGGNDEDEALSLCDLPNKQENQFKKESPASDGGEEEFDFCSWGGSKLKESEMCAADEVFFRGQILPLRHSISSDGGGAGIRCNSMDRCHSAGQTTASSRSSSTRSHQSSSSAASSSTTTTHRKIRNQFQYSQPSPTPQLRFSKAPHANNYARNNSTLWSLFRVGLVTMPEIGSHSFRAQNRDNNNNNNNRNNIVRSGSSSSSIVSNSDTKPTITQKLKQRFSFSDNNLVFFDTCKCSSNSVQTIPSAPAKNQDQKKNKEPVAQSVSGWQIIRKKNTKQQATTTGKQTMSRIRTFEWLKQLSLEAEGAATTVPLNN